MYSPQYATVASFRLYRSDTDHGVKYLFPPIIHFPSAFWVNPMMHREAHKVLSFAFANKPDDYNDVKVILAKMLARLLHRRRVMVWQKRVTL